MTTGYADRLTKQIAAKLSDELVGVGEKIEGLVHTLLEPVVVAV